MNNYQVKKQHYSPNKAECVLKHTLLEICDVTKGIFFAFLKMYYNFNGSLALDSRMASNNLETGKI